MSDLASAGWKMPVARWHQTVPLPPVHSPVTPTGQIRRGARWKMRAIQQRMVATLKPGSRDVPNVRDWMFQPCTFMAWLLIETPDELPRRFRLGKLDAGFGRARTNAVPLADTKCSSFHCVIRQATSERWALADAGSRNGTYLNGVKLDEEHALKDGDEVIIGQTRMRFSMTEPSARFEQVINPDHHQEEFETIREAQSGDDNPRATQSLNLPDLHSPGPLEPTALDMEVGVGRETRDDRADRAERDIRRGGLAGSSDTSVQIAGNQLRPDPAGPAADQTENISLRDLSKMVPVSGRLSAVQPATRHASTFSMVGALMLAFLLGGGLVLTVLAVYPLQRGGGASTAPAIDPALRASLQNLDGRLDDLEVKLSTSMSALSGRQQAEAMLLLDRLSVLDDSQQRVSAETREALQRLSRLNEWIDRLATRLGTIDGGTTVAGEVAALRVQLSLIQLELANLSSQVQAGTFAPGTNMSQVANANDVDPADNNVAAGNNER